MTPKEIQSAIKQKELMIHSLKEQKESIALSVKAINIEIKKLKALRDRKKKKLTVSEHAVLRFIERAMGFDIEQIKERIATKDVLALSSSVDKVSVPIEEGLQAVVIDKVVVTVK